MLDTLKDILICISHVLGTELYTTKKMTLHSIFQETVVCVQECCFLKVLHAFLHALCWFDIVELGRRMRGQHTSLFQSHLSLALSSLAVLSCGGPKSSPFQMSFPEPDPSALELAARTASAI